MSVHCLELSCLFCELKKFGIQTVVSVSAEICGELDQREMTRIYPIHKCLKSTWSTEVTVRTEAEGNVAAGIARLTMSLWVENLGPRESVFCALLNFRNPNQLQDLLLCNFFFLQLHKGTLSSARLQLGNLVGTAGKF